MFEKHKEQCVIATILQAKSHLYSNIVPLSQIPRFAPGPTATLIPESEY